jgi:hypothetical protein
VVGEPFSANPERRIFPSPTLTTSPLQVNEVEDRLLLSCNINAGLFSPDASGERLGLNCDVKTNDGNMLGNVIVSYKTVNGKGKVDFNMSKNLIGNIITDGLNLESLIGTIGNLLS